MQTIGKYNIERVVGRGGMGTVYQALDPVLHRRVALKTMSPGLAGAPDLRARFLREAQAAGGLRHRNIVTVFDLGEDRGQPYIAMEFVEGTDLETIVQRRQEQPVEWTLDVIRQVCEGLGHAHRNGIVHRDVKPANIRITPEGEVKIMDFGIAHLQSSTITKSGLVLGTVHYMAPEQVDGRKVDHRADIFSVGAIAYELLARRRPFDADSLTGVMFKITHEAADLSALPRTAYSPGLETIVGRSLARDPAERYQTLEEMRDDVGRLVRDTAPRLLAEAAEVRRDLEEARAAGRLPKALALCRRLRELDPDDAGLGGVAREIESAIQDREVEQLAGAALGYAAEGDMDLAGTIAARIAQMAPESPRYRELRAYLDEEAVLRMAQALVATAQEHLAVGNLEEAHAAAEEALSAQPEHPLAREIRDRAGQVLAARALRSTPVPLAPAEPILAKATPTPAPAGGTDPGHARPREAAALASKALNHFLLSDYEKARRAAERCLDLDPANRKARELLKILGSLG